MKRLVRILLAACVLTLGWWLLAPSRPGEPAPHLGYVEAETVLVAAKTGGRLAAVSVAEGDEVARGAPLFTLDSDTELQAVAAARAGLAEARARLADALASRGRPEEISVLEAKAEQAQAAVTLATAELERQETLFQRKTTAAATRDRAQATLDEARAALNAARREVEAAKLPARPEQVEAARAAVAAAEAARRQAEQALSDRRVRAPAAGRVSDVMYRRGEFVPAGQPVVELLPPDALRIHFYVREAALADIRPGGAVSVTCDGCPAGLGARVVYVAPEAEYTPPVIFSREERAKLVFLAKAVPEAATDVLKPGMPVEVRAR